MRKLIPGIKLFNKKTYVLAVAFYFILGIVVWGGFNMVIEETNSLSFCISCHEMESTVYQDYKHSVHFTNGSGVRAICSDCHVPKAWIPKVMRKIQASKELYHWVIGSIDTQEKFEGKRHELASRVWASMKSTDSRECRNCHQFSVMALENQARFAARIHADASKNGGTCIDCHKGITHRLLQKKILFAENGDCPHFLPILRRGGSGSCPERKPPSVPRRGPARNASHSPPEVLSRGPLPWKRLAERRSPSGACPPPARESQRHPPCRPQARSRANRP